MKKHYIITALCCAIAISSPDIHAMRIPKTRQALHCISVKKPSPPASLAFSSRQYNHELPWYRYTDFCDAVMRGNIPQVTQFMSEGITPQSTCRRRNVYADALSLALMGKQADANLIKTLLDNDVDPNTPDWSGTTSLMRAVKCNAPKDIVHLLIQYGADTTEAFTYATDLSKSCYCHLVDAIACTKFCIEEQEKGHVLLKILEEGAHTKQIENYARVYLLADAARSISESLKTLFG